MLRLTALLVGGCLVLLGCGGAQRRPASVSRQETVVARASIERTAIWVGDPVTYVIEVVCAPGYDIVEDDLGRDHLRLTGLEVRDAHLERSTRAGGVVAYRAQFQLVSFTSDVETLRIGGRTLRYYQRREDGTVVTERASGTVEIPQEEIVLRSVMPDSAKPGVRTVKSAATVPWSVRAIQPAGLTLVMLSLLILGASLASPVMRHLRTVRRPGPVAVPVTDYRHALAELRRIDTSQSPVALQQAFDQLDRLLRQQLTEAGIDARALTADEIDRRLSQAQEPKTHRPIARVLRECERVRYAGPHHLPTRDLFAQVLGEVEAALSPTEGSRQ